MGSVCDTDPVVNSIVAAAVASEFGHLTAGLRQAAG